MSLPKGLLPIYGTTLADMMGYTLLIPLLPEIARHYGATDIMVGALLSINAALAAVGAPIWGKTSDYLGRKFIILISQCCSLAGYLVLALAHSYWWIFIARVISGFGAGNIGAAQSYIADITREEQREQAYAVFGGVFGSAFILGPVAAGFLAHYGLQFPFYVAALLQAMNIVFTIFFLPSMRRRQRERTSFRETLRTALKPSISLLFARQFLFIFAVVYFLADFSLYLSHALHYDVGRVAWLLASAGVVGGIVSIGVVARLAKRIGDRSVAQIGFLLSFAAYGLVYWVRDLFWFVPVLVLWAIGAALISPIITTLLSERAPKGERGAILGVSDSVNSIALIIAPSIGSAIVGANARLIGILPAIAMLAALWIGPRMLRMPVQSASAQTTQ
jgi:DHA1 family tetracycline resistance protein-like MFS transporter